MTSRERVLRTFGFEKADRMPIDISANIGILQKLLKHFNTDDEGLRRALGVDFRGVAPAYKGKLLFPEKPSLTVNPVYGFYCKWIAHSSGGYMDFTDFPLQDAEPETIASFPVPDPNDFDYETAVANAQKSWQDEAVFVGNAGIADIINSTGRVMGMEQTLMNLMTEDEATLSYIGRRCDMELAQLEKTIQLMKGRVDFLWFGEDLGTQIAPMISLDMYRNVLKPFHKRYADLAKAYGLPCMVHTCGCSSWVYEDFIEMGIRAVDTLQPEAANMSPEYLLERFKGRLAFHGCISTAGALAYGSPQDVDAEVKRVCDLMRPHHCYMISPTHSIQDNSPLENVLQMYQSALKYGKYDRT